MTDDRTVDGGGSRRGPDRDRSARGVDQGRSAGTPGRRVDAPDGERPHGDGSPATDVLVEPPHGRGPGVLVLHSGRGLTPSVETLCDRLSRRGLVAMAVDLFDGATPETVEAAADAKAAVDDRRTRHVLENAASFLRGYETVSRPGIGVLGLGYGAGWACWLASAAPDTVAAVVLFYGYRDVEWDAVDAPVIGHFAELDRHLSPSRVEELREQLLARGVSTDFFVYAGTEPSFFERDTTARYAPEAADLAWERTATFLDRTLHDR